MSDITIAFEEEVDKNFSSGEELAIDITQIIIFVISAAISILLVINIFSYLLKLNRYKDPSILLFYLNSVFIIFAIVMETADRTYDLGICPASQIIDSYSSHSLNLNLGICQACMLTTLSIKLSQLLGFNESMEQTEEELHQ